MKNVNLVADCVFLVTLAVKELSIQFSTEVAVLDLPVTDLDLPSSAPFSLILIFIHLIFLLAYIFYLKVAENYFKNYLVYIYLNNYNFHYNTEFTMGQRWI